jgi:predicted RNA-binding protein YlxR (DUF448 family)
VGCRRRAEPAQLTRLALGSDGRLVVGPGPGRGAWVCSAKCLDEAWRRGSLHRALRGDITDDDIAALRAKLMGPGWFTDQPDVTNEK